MTTTTLDTNSDQFNSDQFNRNDLLDVYLSRFNSTLSLVDDFETDSVIEDRYIGGLYDIEEEGDEYAGNDRYTVESDCECENDETNKDKVTSGTGVAGIAGGAGVGTDDKSFSLEISIDGVGYIENLDKELQKLAIAVVGESAKGPRSKPQKSVVQQLQLSRISRLSASTDSIVCPEFSSLLHYTEPCAEQCSEQSQCQTLCEILEKTIADFRATATTATTDATDATVCTVCVPTEKVREHFAISCAHNSSHPHHPNHPHHPHHPRHLRQLPSTIVETNVSVFNATLGASDGVTVRHIALTHVPDKEEYSCSVVFNKKK
jgi:hypothetical protein